MMATATRASRKSSGTSRSRSRSAKTAVKAVGSHTTVISLPALGTVQLPSKGTFAYFGAVAGLAALGLVEWPVAVIVGVGHMLAQQHGNAVLEEFGEGLGDA